MENIDGFEDPGRADSALMIKLYTTTHTKQYTIYKTQCTKHNTQRIAMHILQVVTTQSHDNTQCTLYNTQHC